VKSEWEESGKEAKERRAKEGRQEQIMIYFMPCTDANTLQREGNNFRIYNKLANCETT
jgi:hypothetical protein